LRREAATLIIKLKHALERALAARKLIRHGRAPPRCVRRAPGDQLTARRHGCAARANWRWRRRGEQ
jgi:hypothetical protein